MRSALVVTLLLFPVHVLPQENVQQLGLSQTTIQPGTEVLAFGLDSSGQDVMLLGPKMTGVVPMNAVGQSRLVTSKDGAVSREYPIDALIPYPVSLSQAHLFFTTPTSNGIAGRVMDLGTGNIATAFEDFRPFAAAFGQNSLAIVGQSSTGAQELRILTGNLFGQKNVYQLPAGLLRGPMMHLVSAGADNTVVLSNIVDATITVLDASSNSLKVGSAKRLEGSEIGKSRDWPNPRPNSKRVVLLAQAPLPGGGLLALLGPYKYEEGYRAVQYDSNGSQTKSWRLSIEGNKVPIDFRPSTVAWTDDEIVILSSTGLRRSYRRPS